MQIGSGSCSASPGGSRELHGFDAAIYTVALLCIGLATKVLIVPVSFHPIVVRRWQKAAGRRRLIVGRALPGPAISCTVLLIVDVVLGRWIGIFCGSGTALVGLLVPSHARARR